MSEGLFSRVTRLISGGVNGVVDAVENVAPQTVMREAIREIDGAVSDVRAELGRAIADHHHASKRLAEAAARHGDLEQKLGLAIEEKRDDLAKAAITRQMDFEAQIPLLETALRDMEARQDELEGYVTALLARKREMEADLAAFVETHGANAANDDVSGDVAQLHGLRVDAATERAETAFNRVLHSASGISGTMRATSETAAELAELEEVARDHRIEERLAEAKAMKAQS